MNTPKTRRAITGILRDNRIYEIRTLNENGYYDGRFTHYYRRHTTDGRVFTGHAALVNML